MIIFSPSLQLNRENRRVFINRLRRLLNAPELTSRPVRNNGYRDPITLPRKEVSDLLITPDRKFIAAGIKKMEPPTTRKGEN